MNKETKRKLNTILKQVFGIKSWDKLYDTQKECIKNILSGQNSLLIRATGGGKSLCYQLPALFFEDGVTVVISPILALIKDQVDSINNAAKSPVAISMQEVFSYKGAAQTKVISDIKAGKYRLLYTTPERLTQIIFLQIMNALGDRIKLIAVDEAHCVSSWGYSFRPGYLDIKGVLDRIENRPVVAAFSATATSFIVTDIQNTLLGKPSKNKKQNLKLIQDSAAFSRDELTLKVIHCLPTKAKSAASVKRKRILEQIENYSKDGKNGIIFCTDTISVKNFTKFLEKRKEESKKDGKPGYCYEATCFYAELSSEDRKKNSARFAPNEMQKNKSSVQNDASLDDSNTLPKANIMVATNAYGLGINKPNIDFVIHYNLPLSIENYWQQVGRAARIRPGILEKPCAECTLYFEANDIKICENLIKSSPLPNIGITAVQRKKMAFQRLHDMLELADPMWFEKDKTKKYSKPSGHVLSDEKIKEYIKNYFEDSETPEELKKIWAKDDRTIPLFVNRTLIANLIRKGIYKKDQTFYVDKELSYFDMMVADAVYTLSLYKRPINCKSIFCTLAGDNSLTITANKHEKIKQAIYNLAAAKIHIGSDDNVELTPFLEITESGNNFFLKNEMPLYAHADQKKHYHIFSNEMLTLSYARKNYHQDGKYEMSKLDSSIDNLILKHFLLRRIDSMTQPRRDGVKPDKVFTISNRIRFFPKEHVDANEKDLFEAGKHKILFDQLGLYLGSDKYKRKRRYEILVGNPAKINKTDLTIDKLYETKGRIAQILDYMKQNHLFINYKIACYDDEALFLPDIGYHPLMYTYVEIEMLSREDKIIFAKNR